MTTRRTFIKSSLASSALISLSGAVPQFLLRASGASPLRPDLPVLVVVQLTGGNDGLNTVIPYSDDEYHANRFTLAINRNQVLKLDDHIGLHPSMRALADLIEHNSAAVIQGVGYPNPNRSHFESMDLWHTAHRKTGPHAPGWLGRTFGQLDTGNDVPAMHIGAEQQPLALTNPDRPAVSIRTLENFQLRAARKDRLQRHLKSLIQRQRSGSGDLLGFIQQNANVALLTSQRLESVVSEGNSARDYPNSPLARKLRSVASLIAAGLKTRIYYVSLGGFDTHAAQGQTHGNLLGQFANAVAAFHRDLQTRGLSDRVALVSFSEFGRRVRENASRGTDHGTAGPMFVVHPGLRSGIIGQHPSLTDLDQGDLKFRIDYRTVYAELLENWLGIPAAPIVGAGYEPTPLFARSS